MPTTGERLGYPSDARLLIINGDDIGMCHAANVATVNGLKNGILTSSSLMVPCPWALEAVQMAAGLDVGIHLTLTAEWTTYRWGPLTAAGREQDNGLVDAEGYFWHGTRDVHEHADRRTVRAEAEAQIEWAVARGLDFTSLDNHMGTVSSHPELLAIYVDLARAYRLPLRLEPAHSHVESERNVLADITSAARADILAPDHLAGLPLDHPERLESQMLDSLRGLKPGITEFILHASAPGDELTAIAPDAAARVEAYRLVTSCAAVRQVIEAEGITLIGYRALRDAQRAGA